MVKARASFSIQAHKTGSVFFVLQRRWQFTAAIFLKLKVHEHFPKR
jgi:hypothetical protein